MNDSSRQLNRIPSLDGLRTVSIGFVLLLHMSGGRNFISYEAVDPINAGGLGVLTFFVISGFLITTLLLREQRRSGVISLKGFYFRRALRIFPAFYAYVAVAAILSLTGVHVLPASDFLRAVTFTSDYGRNSWFLGHFWSLSVEEQFYLLWPAALYFLGREKGIKLAIGVMLATPLIRLGLWQFVPAYHPYIGRTFETCADALAAGCVLAGVRDSLGKHSRYLNFLRSPLFLLVPAGILAGSMSFNHPRICFVLGTPLENVCIALLIDRVVRIPNDFFGKVLNSRPFVFIGTLSYSLYLWQQLFCRRDSPEDWSTWFPLNLALALICAMACHFLIEKPVLRLKTRFKPQPAREVPVTANHRQLQPELSAASMELIEGR